MAYSIGWEICPMALAEVDGSPSEYPFLSGFYREGYRRGMGFDLVGKYVYLFGYIKIREHRDHRAELFPELAKLAKENLLIQISESEERCEGKRLMEYLADGFEQLIPFVVMER